MKICFVARRSIYRYFLEYLDAIIYWMKESDMICDLFFQEDESLYQKIESYDFIINVQTLLLDVNKIKNVFKRVIIFNTEQNTRNTYYLEHILNMMKMGFKIMDYHLGNIELMNKMTNHQYKDKILYLPPLYCPDDKLYESKKSKDICFVGTLTDYRQKLLKRLGKRFNIDTIQDFGEIRDKNMSKYKILLNLHADPDYQVFETIRCYRCVFNKILVISQQKLIKENSEIESFCYFSNDDNLERTIDLILSNYDKIISEKYKNIDIDYFRDWSKKKMENFIKIVSN
jgi:hypothetical protein